MTTIQQHFGFSVRWNILESVWYQVLLFGHQYALYSLLPATDYGLIGTYFSLVYLSIQIFNVGLDKSISPYFADAIQSKKSAYAILIQPIVWHFLFLLSIVSCGLIGIYYNRIISLSLGLLLGCMCISEALKKTVRSLLHCAFRHDITTVIELITISSYILCIWFYYYLGYPLNTYALLIPMVITSAISLIVLIYYAYQWFINLPDTDQYISISLHRMIRHRLGVYGTQLSTLFFSSNFLVPLFAWQYGLEYAAVLKLIGYLHHVLHTIIHKIVGSSLYSCFAALKYEQFHLKYHFFNQVTYYVYQLLYGIFIFIAVNYYHVVSFKDISVTSPLFLIGYLFFIAILIENFLVSYEQLYQAEEKTYYINSINSMCLFILLLFCLTPIITNPAYFLTFFIIIRSIAIMCIAWHAYCCWSIPIQYAPQFATILYAFLCSTFFFALMQQL